MKIYRKVFIDLATKYSKHPKRFLSNTKNWGKRSDTLSWEVEHSIPRLLDNKIFSKRIWLEENNPEQNSNAPDSKKDDVISSRISYIRKSDMNTRLFLYNMFSNHGSLKPVLSNVQESKDKRRIGMIQNSPMFDEYG